MTRQVPAVVRALDVLELFLDGDVTLTSRQVTERLGLPRTTVHELTHTLVARGYLAPDGPGGAFRLGVRALQLGSAYTAGLGLAEEGRRAAEAVRAECDETVHVGVLDGTDVVYVAKVDSSRSVRMVSEVGRRLPAHCSAVGKVLLSGLPDEELRRRLPADGRLAALTPRTTTSVEALLPALDRVRRRGLAYEQEEANPDVSCAAAPVHDHRGAMVAAMSVSVPTTRWLRRSRAAWGRLVHDGASALSARLGHTGPDRR